MCISEYLVYISVRCICEVMNTAVHDEFQGMPNMIFSGTPTSVLCYPSSAESTSNV